MAHLLWERDEAHAQAEALASASRRLEACLGIASHELRAPVMSSSLAVQVAARQLDLLQHHMAQHARDAAMASEMGTMQDALMTAESSLDRLSRMVSDLPDVTCLKSGQLAVRPAPADLRALVRAAVDEQRRLAPTRRIWLHLPAQREAPVWADADRIHQVVTNYLTTSLKHAPDDRPVDVRVQLQAGWARVSVRDQGPGMAAGEQAGICEPFHRTAGVEVAGEASR